MRILFNFSFNGVVKRFIMADLMLWAGWGLIAPVFAIFVLDQVRGATVVTLGIVAALYWILKSIIQIPIALAIDRTPSEKDDYLVLVISLMLGGLTAFSFILVREVWQLYLVEALHAVSFGLYIPAWSGIFARHLDKSHRALEFSLDSAAVGIAMGITGLIGGVIVQNFGFSAIFFIASLLCFISAIIIFYSPDIVFPRRRELENFAAVDHTPRNLGK